MCPRPHNEPARWAGELCGWGQRCVTPRQTCPRPEGSGRNLRSKTRWFTGSCNSHQVSHFATFFIDARAEISVAESRLDYHQKKARPRRRGLRGRAPSTRFPWRFSRRGSFASRAGRGCVPPRPARTRGAGAPRAQHVMPRVRGSFC